MPLIVNGERVDDEQIVDEMRRMRPDHDRVFQEMTAEKREAQLLEWAKENVLERILIRQAADDDARPLPAEQLNKAFEKFVENIGGQDNQEALQAGSDQNAESVKRGIELQLKVERLIEEISSEITSPDEEEVRRYYQEHLGQYQAPEQVHAAHIVKHVNASTSASQARREIEKIQERLNSGESFEILADTMSDCPGNGGDLGWFPRGQMVAEFDEVVFAGDPGEISDVFETELGFHIARIFEKTPSAPIPYEKIRDRILNTMIEEERNRRIEAFVDARKADADVSFVVDSELRERMDAEKQAHIPEHYTKTLNSILVKPAGPDCNMACTYCFYLEKHALFPDEKHRMSEDILEEMIRQAMVQSRGSLNFGWQGGEPTLMGLDFFKKAVEYQKKYGHGQLVGNGLQTNGLLIDAAWVEFLKENRFLVGLSLDGPEHVHDYYRRLRGGKASFERVAEKGRMMLSNGVAVNALTVVNDYSVQFPEEIYAFHQSFGFTFMQFIPCVERELGKAGRLAAFTVEPESYGRFLIRLFDLWKEDFKNGEPSTSIRFFDSVFHSYVGLKPPECTLLDECGIYIVVEHNGDVYACDFFVDPEWRLGNLMEDRLVDLLNNPKQKAFGEAKLQLPSDCTNCRWLAVCHGGCPKDRLAGSDRQVRNHLCEAYKQFFEYADDTYQRLAEAWKRNQARTESQRAVRESARKGTLRVGRNDPCPCGSGKKYKMCCGTPD